jgi:heat shock protein 1/8
MNAAMFKSTIEHVDKVLVDAKVPRNGVDEIVLVGGSTRIPKIQALISEYFDGRKADTSINCDDAVTYGAVVQAALLTGQIEEKTKDIVLRDVAGQSLGIGLVGDVLLVVIPCNTQIPTSMSRPFYTSQDNQTSVNIPV